MMMGGYRKCICNTCGKSFYTDDMTKPCPECNSYDVLDTPSRYIKRMNEIIHLMNLEEEEFPKRLFDIEQKHRSKLTKLHKEYKNLRDYIKPYLLSNEVDISSVPQLGRWTLKKRYFILCLPKKPFGKSIDTN